MKNSLKIKTPSNIYLWWNFGSTIFLMMMIQMITGLMLSMNYFTKNNLFESSMNIFFNLNYGWIIRLAHSNMTSMIFMMMLIHMSRTMFFKSFFIKNMWMSGMIMMMMMMMESFIGYSLVWNQMSYWAMMVITNFISSIPFLGKKLVKLIWGNFSIDNILLNRFFSIHFMIPMMIMITSMIHMKTLHTNKSNNPLGMKNKMDMLNLNPIMIVKDSVLSIFLMWMFMNMILMKPKLFSNSDNFIKMNYFKTPNHIEPEWYFLFFYSILRSISDKLSGLMMMILSMIMMAILPKMNKSKFQSFSIINKTFMIMLISTIILIGMMSKKNSTYPFNYLNKTMIYLFFMMFPMMFFFNKYWNKKF